MSFEKGPSSETEARSPEQMKKHVLSELKDMLTKYYSDAPSTETFDSLEGKRKEHAVRAHAYIEGYMGALLDANVITMDELDEVTREAKSSASS